jgi:hypothetical protein
MTLAYQFNKLFANLLGGETAGESLSIDWLSDTIKVALLANTYTPAKDTHEFFGDVNADEVSGAGYTVGGATLGSKTLTYTPANSWGTAWGASTAYAVGDVVRPTAGNGHLYVCVVAGTSAASPEPTWPTVANQTVTDGSVTWAEVGSGVTVLDSADPAWAASTITARYAAYYKDTGTPTTSPLLSLVDFESDQSSVSGTFTIVQSANGILRFFS